MPAICPDPTDPDILRFCREIVPGARPRLMRVIPVPGAMALDCFENVRMQVAAAGGRIQFGWSVWEWPGVYVEAEHHAVHAPANDASWHDVTPSLDEDTSRCFLPDDAAVYDFATKGVARPSHRLSLVDDPLVTQLFEVAFLQDRIRAEILSVGDPDVSILLVNELERSMGMKE